MTKSISCSWCHTVNPAGATRCDCGHNPSRSRMECDCPSCVLDRQNWINCVAEFPGGFARSGNTMLAMLREAQIFRDPSTFLVGSRVGDKIRAYETVYQRIK